MSKQASFAAGCFWGIESKFGKIPGVIKTEVGYSGGTVPNPSYERVCGGDTGHRETVRVEYDPNVISYEELLEHFWDMHDPTALNRQGFDVGYQYGSAIFYQDEEQHKLAEQSKQDWEARHKMRDKIMTDIVPAGPFYRAEEYHQKYLEKKKK